MKSRTTRIRKIGRVLEHLGRAVNGTRVRETDDSDADDEPEDEEPEDDDVDEDEVPAPAEPEDEVEDDDEPEDEEPEAKKEEHPDPGLLAVLNKVVREMDDVADGLEGGEVSPEQAKEFAEQMADMAQQVSTAADAAMGGAPVESRRRRGRTVESRSPRRARRARR